jgi:uncharacterized linocin/CFP29 family protein
MNNLHRDLAPISDLAWARIEEEATRTLKRHLAGRRVVDVRGPAGLDLAAVGTGHLQGLDPHVEGIEARLRVAQSLVELRVPFNVGRQAVDDVERGAEDSDWEPVKNAARQIAFAEDRAIFEGFAAAQIKGIRQATANPVISLPGDARAYPDTIAESVSGLRLVGVNGPYSLVLSAEAYTLLNETRDNGYPVMDQIRHIVDGDIIWAPAILGAFVLTTRGGDFVLHVGEDVSIGYLSHNDTSVRLYLEESMTFLCLTAEAAIAFSTPGPESQ